MINIVNKKKCCGCSACASICPKQCIKMIVDNEGFLYPEVDRDTCIDCGLCERVCNELHPYDKRKPIKVLAAINKNEEIRMKSSSGGIFYILADRIINEGGVVFGARFDENWQVVIDYAEEMKGVEAFMGSKYVQARIENAYKDVKRFLAEGRKVLFTGTPCQVAGLHKFLRKSYDNLLTVDIICHGTPSPKVWRMYLDAVLQSSTSIGKISFRNKTHGWKNFHFLVEYDGDSKTTSLLSSPSENQYMKAFLSNLILRPSCSSCVAKSCSSQSDITLADFWGIWNVNPQMHDNKGTSLLFINTDKGINALPNEAVVQYAESDYETAIKYNTACSHSVFPHPKREAFFEQFQQSQNVSQLIDKTLLLPLSKRFTIFIKKVIRRLIKFALTGGGEKKTQ